MATPIHVNAGGIYLSHLQYIHLEQLFCYCNILAVQYFIFLITNKQYLTKRIIFSYIIQNNVCYLTLCDQSFSPKLAFKFLDDISGEFQNLYTGRVEEATRPYHFIEFGEQNKLNKIVGRSYFFLLFRNNEFEF